MAVQRFLVRGQHLEIADRRVSVQLAVQQAHGILHKLQIGSVQFGKRLLVLALDHHLRLRLQGFQAQIAQFLNRERPVQLHRDARHRALAVRDGSHPARLDGVLRQLIAARAGGGVDKVQVQQLAHVALAIHVRLHRRIIILVAHQPRTQRLLAQRVAEAQRHMGVQALQVAPVAQQDGFERVGRKKLVAVLVKAAHDARHVDALLVRLQRHRTRDGGFQQQRLAGSRRIAQGQAEVVDAHLLDSDHAALNERGRPILQIGQAAAIGVRHHQFRVIEAPRPLPGGRRVRRRRRNTAVVPVVPVVPVLVIIGADWLHLDVHASALIL